MKEFHYILKADDVQTLMELQDAYFATQPAINSVFKRYFLSDVCQRDAFPSENGAVSYIVQPPLDGCKVAVWIYAVSDADVNKKNNLTVVSDEGKRHIWSSGINGSTNDPYGQTSDILNSYRKDLAALGLSLPDDCVRTWFFVDDIDHNYEAMVLARRKKFNEIGLTPETHYIASTGIAGTPCPAGSVVMMDAWAIDGLNDNSKRYLYAPTHLNPTYEYGVTFERGVRLDFSSTAHIVISGTASIDNKGSVLHIGDVEGQTLRMWKNVEALMAEGGASWPDVKVILVYIRNASDYDKVAALFSDKFPSTPYIILNAPVCRPDWLIEMECIASFDL